MKTGPLSFPTDPKKYAEMVERGRVLARRQIARVKLMTQAAGGAR